jgi:hypothetical protein
MARHIVKRDGATLPEAAEETGGPIPTLVGGTSGAPPDPNPRSTAIHGLHDVLPAPARAEDEGRSAEQRRYRVVETPPSVMYEGQRLTMNRGKIYAEGCVDLDFLRDQGVVFEEVGKASSAA